MKNHSSLLTQSFSTPETETLVDNVGGKQAHQASAGTNFAVWLALIDSKETSKRLCCNPRSLANWLWIPRIKMGKSVRFFWPDVLKAVQARSTKGVE